MRCNRLSLWLASALIAAPSLALAAEEKKAGMPQLDPENFAPQIVWLVITFAILYVLLSRIGLPRVMEILDARHKRLDADLGEAERLKRETEQAIATYEAALTAARARAQAVTSETRTKFNAEMATARAQLENKLMADGKAADASILAAKQSALAGLTQAATEVATDVVNRLIDKPADPASVKSAVAKAMAGKL